ncbi:MAG: hypothetical protein WBM96_05245, partial [Polyangiales bacterium]
MLSVKTVDDTEEIEIDRAFQVRMTVKYDLATAEADTAVEKAKSAEKAEKRAGEKLEAQE